MKGKNPTEVDKLYWDRLITEVGCIACFLDGHVNHNATIHHCDGRTRPGAHRRVLPLCFFHHQSGDISAPSIHPYKARFEQKYGSQESLVKLCKEILDGV